MRRKSLISLLARKTSSATAHIATLSDPVDELTALVAQATALRAQRQARRNARHQQSFYEALPRKTTLWSSNSSNSVPTNHQPQPLRLAFNDMRASVFGRQRLITFLDSLRTKQRFVMDTRLCACRIHRYYPLPNFLFRIWELALRIVLRFYRQFSFRIKYQPI